jgi:hypothetical protein
VVQGVVKAEQFWCALLFCSQKSSISRSPVYYLLHDDDTIEAALNSLFDESLSSLGRIVKFTIPPPPTVAFSKDCFVRVVGVSGHDVQLLDGGHHGR